MKVLITGGYGFIGSHVAERFDKEGDEVYIIDNLSTGDRTNVSFRHKSYVLSVDDPKCEEIFKSHRFDVVVHMASQGSGSDFVHDPEQDSESNVTGLVNMLKLSRKYQVKKFIFASSADVYGRNANLPVSELEEADPVTPYGIGKWASESYCIKWMELYGLETICFRISTVFGPGQGQRGEGGIISLYMKAMLAGQALTVYGDAAQTRDYIYVTDVADAIYRSSYSSLAGIYNLSANHAVSISDLTERFRDIQGDVRIEYQDERFDELAHLVLDNTRLKRDLDWAPMYSLQEGLQKTYEWYRDHRVQPTPRPKRRGKSSNSKLLFKRILPYAENLIACTIAAWLSLGTWDDSYAYLDIKLFYIVLIGIIYGNRQAMIAVALSTGLLIYEKLDAGREIISLLNDTHFYFQVTIYLSLGLIVGYSIERKNRQLQSQKENLSILEDKYEFLNEIYTEVRNVKDELYERIMNDGDSFGKLYAITKALESLEPEQIFTSTVQVVERVMRGAQVTIYATGKNNKFIRLVSHSKGVIAPKSLRVDEHPYLQDMFESGRPFINRDLQSGQPLMSASVRIHGGAVTIISIDGIPFERFNLYYENLFKVTVDLVSSALTRAYSYIEAAENQRYEAGTQILRREVFDSILDNKKTAKERYQTDYLLLSCELKAGEARQEVAERLSALLRETDYIGADENGGLLVLLSNTDKDDAPHVMRRFEKANLQLKIIERDLVRHA